jgi:amino acid permease
MSIHCLTCFSFSTQSFMEGLSNFKNGQAFIGGFSAFAANFVYAFFSFGGVELVAVAAGESLKPYKSVPRAIKATFFRIVLFYILTILTIGLCINHADPTLPNASSKWLSSFIPSEYTLKTKLMARRRSNCDCRFPSCRFWAGHTCS